jgi:carboxymethylenebutenolidase
MRTETVVLDDDGQFRLTIAEPDSTVRGGIVVLHEARGVTDTVRSMMSILANEGWLAVAPHLYHRNGPDEVDREQVADQLNRLTPESVLADSDVALGWLRERGVTADQIGVLGFDLGGAVAVKVGTKRTVGAAVSVSAPGILNPIAHQLRPLLETAPELTCPWLGIFGGDETAPAEEVEKLRDAAAGAAVATDVVRYPDANHRFDTDRVSATDAWHRTLNWFGSHLR